MTDKTISYRRAVWLERQQFTLEHHLSQARSKLLTVADRKVERGNVQLLKCLRFSSLRAGGILMHVVAETPGDRASILHAEHDSAEGGDVAVTAAPRGSEFMDGDIFALVRADDVCICATGLREQSLTFYLQRLFEKALLPRTASAFQLQAVGNANKLRMIAQGVKRIELGATVQEATRSYTRRRHEPRGFLRSIGSEIINIFGVDARAIQDNLQVSVSIYSNGRLKTGRHEGDERLQRLARDLVETEGDDYVIHTKSGQSISQNEVFIRTRVRLEGHGKSVSRHSAWQALREFYATIHSTGISSQ